MNAHETDHWWFVARRKIITSLIDRHIATPAGSTILEAGCGTGGNLAMLARYGAVDALEYDEEAATLSQARGIAHVERGALPDAIGFQDKAYDMIVLLDVLEHVDADIASLAALGRRLKPNSKILLTVPAVPWLWSDHDAMHHHKRRYTFDSLRRTVEAAGLKLEVAGYFNSLLFPLAVIQRAAHHVFKSDRALDARPSAPVNWLLRSIFAAERYLLHRIRFPIGLSLYAVIRA